MNLTLLVVLDFCFVIFEVSRLRMSGAIPLLPRHAVMVWKGTTLLCHMCVFTCTLTESAEYQ
jgi:hypothetical protein